ncbi:GrpB family protein [Lederbergia ruris]|uniref:GrpB family protein n=1 Tax=Lederbergia ruris TaxID=217495 RepID=UPI00278C57C0|nr:GrpB family protein [Lederbergia ruris]
MRKTRILPWTEEWFLLYAQEKQRLQEIFKDEVVDIFHIGSTSVPAIGHAKPIIDILIVVKEIERVDHYNDRMVEFGYEERRKWDPRKKISR